MTHTSQTVRMYEDLAYIYDRQNQPSLRDWFLILAADSAYSAGWEDETERLRVQLLSYNPHHLLKPFASFAEARRSADIQNYIEDLRGNYPPETAEQMLENHRPSILTSASKQSPRSENSKVSGREKSNGTEKKPRILYAEDSGEQGPLLTTSPIPHKPCRSRSASPGPNIPKAFALRPSPLVAISQKTEPAPQTQSEEDLPEETERGNFANRTITTFLFLLFCLLALAVAAYVLILPFLPFNLS